MLKNKKGFTLIEVLAIIIILAIIALIAIPNINGYVNEAHEQSFKTSIDSLMHAYEYKMIDEGDIGRVTACDLDVNKCSIKGYVEFRPFSDPDPNPDPYNPDKPLPGEVCVYLTNGSYCSIGCGASVDTKPGNCTVDDPHPPVINNILITNITVSSAKVLVSFTEEGLVASLRFRLLDSTGRVVRNWQNATTIDNSSDDKVGKIEYTGLDQGKTYKVQVEIKNNAETNNTATGEKTFSTVGFVAPRITYSTNWEKEKTVTITYTNLEGVVNRYRVLTTNNYPDEGWTDVSGTTKTLTIKKYHYVVQAKSSVGGTNQNSSAQIGYVDNEADENNTKPTSQISDYKNGSAINTKQVNITMNDTLSGVGYYCISTTNNPNNCSGTGNNTQLNKWVLASSAAEVREKTMQHQLENGGTYYSFVKDYVGNLSDPNQFTVYKVHYDLNDGTGTVSDQIKVKGSSLTLSDVTPTRSGYEFLGWDTNKSSHTAAYAKKGAYTTDRDVTLYAIWRKKITITYNANSGTGTVQASSCYKYNAEATCSITFRENGYSRTGYTFTGWALGQNGAISYNANTAYDIAENTTVYAGWKANSLTFNNQSFTKTFDTASQTISITGASNGNGSYTYSEVSEKQGSTSTNYISIASNGTITLAGSIPVGTYTYVVRATSQVSNNVDSQTTVTKDATMTIKINSYDFSTGGSGSGLGISIASIADQTYKNGEIKPTPAVTIKTSTGATVATLTSGTDFTYSYSSNINVGTATITVTGKGNYTGSQSSTFKIVPYNISGATFGTIDPVTYNSKAQTPTPSVSALGKTLQVNTDFTYGYSANTNAGTGTVTITGKGNFTGTKQTTFVINKYDISGATIATITAVTYSGTQHKPTPAVTAFSPVVTLSSTSDYTYSYGTNTNAGTGTVTVTGKGNYTGSKTANFTINPYPAPTDPIICATNLKYTGSEQGLIATVNLKNGTIRYNVGSQATSSSSTSRPTGTNAGSYTVYWYAPADNYAESRGSVTCTISAATLNVPGNQNPKSYTGNSISSGITCPSGSTAGGTQSATNVGTYYHRCTLNNPSGVTNYKWNDGSTGYKDISWSISKITGATTGSCNNLTYTGSAQTLASGGSYVSYVDNSGTNATSYTVTVNADGNHTFSDGSTTKTLSCSIARKNVAEPSCTARTYNGSNQVLLAAKTSGEYTNPVMQGTNATSYSVVLTLNSNYQWSSGSSVTSNRTKTCSIASASLTAPSQPTDKTYTGSSISSGITCPSGSTAGGTQSATNVGTYYHRCTLNNPSGVTNYKWSDGTTGYKDIPWKIVKAKTATTGSCQSRTYTGSAQTLASGGSYVSYVNNSGTNATSYIVTVNSDANHTFSDGTTSKTLTCSISPATLSGSVKITGENKANSTLTATVTNTNSATLTYQWYYKSGAGTTGGTAISGATGSTYKVTTSLIGKNIYVVVTASKSNYNTATWSDDTDATNNGSAAAKAGYVCPSGTTTTTNTTLGAGTDNIICTVANVPISRCTSVPSFSSSNYCRAYENAWHYQYPGTCNGGNTYYSTEYAKWTLAAAAWQNVYGSADSWQNYSSYFCGYAQGSSAQGVPVYTTEGYNAAKANCASMLGKTVYSTNGKDKTVYQSDINFCSNGSPTGCPSGTYGYYLLGINWSCYLNYVECSGSTMCCGDPRNEIVEFACSKTEVTEYTCPSGYNKVSDINTSALQCYVLPTQQS